MARGAAVRSCSALGQGENFFASDVSAIVAYTRDAIYLKDYDIAALTRDEFEITSLLGGASGFEVSKVEFSEEDVSKGDFAHYMLKEIYEQPATIQDAMRGRLSREEATAKLGGLEMTNARIARARAHHSHRLRHREPRGDGRRIYHRGARACAVRGRICERVSLPQHAADRRTRSSFVISQSGETADTLAALRESQRKGHRTLGICNNVASTIARESDGGVYMHAGPEIGVAATKSFTSQVTIMTLIGLLLGRIRHLSTTDGLSIIDELEAIPGKVAEILATERPHQSDRREVRPRAGDDVPRAAVQLSRRARRCAEDEGDQLHPRERTSERGAEARRHRA